MPTLRTNTATTPQAPQQAEQGDTKKPSLLARTVRDSARALHLSGAGHSKAAQEEAIAQAATSIIADFEQIGTSCEKQEQFKEKLQTISPQTKQHLVKKVCTTDNQELIKLTYLMNWEKDNPEDDKLRNIILEKLVPFAKNNELLPQHISDFFKIQLSEYNRPSLNELLVHIQPKYLITILEVIEKHKLPINKTTMDRLIQKNILETPFAILSATKWLLTCNFGTICKIQKYLNCTSYNDVFFNPILMDLNTQNNLEIFNKIAVMSNKFAKYPEISHTIAQIAFHHFTNDQKASQFIKKIPEDFSKICFPVAMLLAHTKSQISEGAFNNLLEYSKTKITNKNIVTQFQGLAILLLSNKISKETKEKLAQIIYSSNEIKIQGKAVITPLFGILKTTRFEYCEFSKACIRWIEKCTSSNDFLRHWKIDENLSCKYVDLTGNSLLWDLLQLSEYPIKLIKEINSYSNKTTQYLGNIKFSFNNTPEELKKLTQLCLQNPKKPKIAIENIRQMWHFLQNYINLEQVIKSNPFLSKLQIIANHNNAVPDDYLKMVACLTLAINLENVDFFYSTLDCIEQYIKNIQTKQQITLLWFHLAAQDNSEKFNEFIAFLGNNNKTRVSIKTITLIPIFFMLNFSNTELPKSVHKIINSRIFKDGKKLCNFLQILCNLFHSSHCSAEESWSIFLKCTGHLINKTPLEIKNEFPSGVNKHMQAASACLQLHEVLPNKKIKNLTAQLKSDESPIEPTGLLNDLLPEVLGQENIPEGLNYSELYLRYQQQSRQPGALLNYFINVLTSFDTLSQASEAQKTFIYLLEALANQQKSANAHQSRTFTLKNTHTDFLQNNAPQAWEEWQKDEEWCISPENLDTNLINPANYLYERIINYTHVSQGTLPNLEKWLKNWHGDQSNDGDINSESLANQDTNTINLTENKPEQKIDSCLSIFLQNFFQNNPSSETLSLALKALDMAIQFSENIDGFTQFKQDLIDLQANITASPQAAKTKNFKITISSNRQDRFLCGKEVGGSCQSTDSNGKTSRALTSYVLDDKYKIAAVTKEDGTLMARRMLRLLWDTCNQKPVIHIEKEYNNPGVPTEAKTKLLQEIVNKAGAMQAGLATNDEELLQMLNIDQQPPIELHAYGSGCPYEYVDALGGIQRNGEYTLEAYPLPTQTPASSAQRPEQIR